jgi:hypothetical protein
VIRSRPAGLAPPAAARTQKSARPGDDQNPAGLREGRGRRARLRDWAELLRASALFTVPGDALAGAAATGLRPNRGTAYAAGASLRLNGAGMALDGWADRDEDAVDRPHRPVPSGRISPAAAPGATGLPTAAGLTFTARAGGPAAAVAPALTATSWTYDLRLKHTPAAPADTAPAREKHRLRCRTAVVPLDPSPVRGSHCRLPTSDDVRALVLVSTPRAVSGR